MTFNEKVSFTDYASGIRLPDCSKFAINWKNNNGVTICRDDVIAKLFWRHFVSLAKFIYWSKFHVNVITGKNPPPPPPPLPPRKNIKTEKQRSRGSPMFLGVAKRASDNKLVIVGNKLHIRLFLIWPLSQCAYQGVRNVRFSENSACFVFLKHPFWDRPFCPFSDEL